MLLRFAFVTLDDLTKFEKTRESPPLSPEGCQSPTSLPWFCRNSTSCWEKVVMEMDLTLWGGLRPLLGHGGEMERGIQSHMMQSLKRKKRRKRRRRCGDSWSLSGDFRMEQVELFDR